MRELNRKLMGTAIATTEMKENFSRTPEVLYINATRKVTKNGFFSMQLCAKIGNGGGQPVFLCLLPSEKAENLVFHSHYSKKPM